MKNCDSDWLDSSKKGMKFKPEVKIEFQEERF